MPINLIGVYGVGFVLLISGISILLVFRRKKTTNRYVITPEEKESFLNDSIAIQPTNTVVFRDLLLDEVIKSGSVIMNEDGYKMLKGVDMNGL